MKVAGWQKLSLIDYPDKIACIIFTQGCGERCPFCHNWDILDVNKPGKITEKTILNFLNTRINKIDGVVISGGEPTLQADLLDFLQKIKNLKFKVKLDSNGTNPKVLQNILDQNLVDYIAMDIKQTLKKYPLATGKNTNIKNIQKSIKLIQKSNIEYEFRTTIVPSIQTEKDIYEIAKLLKDGDKYVLQEFRPQKTLDKNLPFKIKMVDGLNLENIKKNLETKYKISVKVRKNI